MKITKIDTTIVKISRSRDLATAYGVSTSTNTVVVQVRTDEGITGIGQTVAPAPWGGDTVETVKHHIEDRLQPALLGEDPFNIERLHLLMFQAHRAAINARTAIDFALWDIKGKALGWGGDTVPVYQLLGGSLHARRALSWLCRTRRTRTRWRRVSKNWLLMAGPGSKPRSASASTRTWLGTTN